MTGTRVAVLVGLAFVGGVASARLVPAVRAQGRVTELKRVDLGSWCEGKEAVISIEEIAPQHQSKHFHPAYSFAWMIEGSQRRFVEGKPPETFRKGDVTQENPGEVSESDILTPTRVLLFRILQKGQPPTTRLP
jgi:quercetin dioxygenase-like cupin family protein